MINDLFKKRFNELQGEYEAIRFWPNSEGRSGTHAEEGVWQKWGTSVQNLILGVFGLDSPHYQNFIEAYKKCRGYDHSLNVLKGIFLSAKDDFEGGYVFNVDLRVSGEVFGDFVSMAKQSLSEGYKDVAAVLACAALEDTLKRYALTQGLEVSDKTMSDVINALKSKGLVSGAQKSLLDSMPKIRNYALHANWDKITAPDVASVTGFVEQFLLTKFTA